MKVMKPSLSQTTPVKCEECESEYFTEVLTLRKASKLLTGSEQDTIIPIPTMRCADCGHINKDFKLKTV